MPSLTFIWAHTYHFNVFLTLEITDLVAIECATQRSKSGTSKKDQNHTFVVYATGTVTASY